MKGLPRELRDLRGHPSPARTTHQKPQGCTQPRVPKVKAVPNRLARESSLYLKQHADNPVDWWPWCPEAFATAKAQDKPVLVSVGYSSCHWCHVMADESFAQPWIADLMNQHFVCIKVDREEKPEVDKLMMDAVQMIQGHGGWPLNTFCLPDGRPFFGGTYFPPEDRGHGQVPWPQLLMRVADFYHTHKSELAANADAIAKNLTHLTSAPEADGSSPSPEDLIQAAKKLCEQHDDNQGGFTAAPKFPSPSLIDFLLSIRSTATVEKDRAFATRIDAVITITLGAMARGGLFDQIGGGFHRYCVDQHWTVPHFEKMLYDNAQLLGTYAEAWARYREPLYARVCEEIVVWLEREMVTHHRLFASALDADTEHHEGKTYVWKPSQVVEILGEEARLFAAAYGITDQGNFEGANILKLRDSIEVRDRYKVAREKLLMARNQRPQPTRDDKALVSWNALLARNLAKAGWIFGRKDWWNRGSEIEAVLWSKAVQERENLLDLHTVCYGTNFVGEGNLTDYTWFAEMELALASTASWANGVEHPDYAQRAEKLITTTQKKFKDLPLAGYFIVGDNRTDLALRQKEWFDNATPAGNSSLIHSFSALSILTGNDIWRKELAEHVTAYGGMARRIPSGVGHALTGLTWAAIGLSTIRCPIGSTMDECQQALCGNEKTPAHQRPYRPLFLIHHSAKEWVICIGNTCLPPVHSWKEVAEFL